MKKGKLTAEQIEAAAWAAGLATSVVVDEVPRGWMTSRQLAKKLNKGESTMNHLLVRAVAEGRAERQSFRIVSGQVTRPVPHYRLK
jgi:hypothetical protein